MLPATTSRRSAIHIQRAQSSLPLRKFLHSHSADGSNNRCTCLTPHPRTWAPVGPWGSCLVNKLLPTQGVHRHHNRMRCIHIPPVVYLAPLTFGGLLVALYVWKCLMLVVFQNKIIYMPGFPPNARSQRIVDYAGRQCGDIDWSDERTTASDGTELAMAVAAVPLPTGGQASMPSPRRAKAHVYVLYFQGW